MNLGDFLLPDRTVVGLESETVDGAARILRDRLVAVGAVNDPDKLRRRMNEERPEDLVAMGIGRSCCTVALMPPRRCVWPSAPRGARCAGSWRLASINAPACCC